VEERIFSSLGMTSSTFSPNKAEASGKLTQGWTKDGRRLPEWFTEDTAFLKAGPGGIISNAIDMVRSSELLPVLLLTSISHSPSGFQRGRSRRQNCDPSICVPGTYPILTPLLLTTQPILSIRSLDMVWVGPAVRIDDVRHSIRQV
jgi:hypothetical protein